MTVSELIAELQKADGDRQVILAKDTEGNAYSPLDYLWEGAYRPYSGWAGEVGLGAGQKSVILCPVN